MEKGPDAFRTISEVAHDLGLPQHVLRFWETRFAQIRPMKRGGGRRYYRPEDVLLLRGIRHLLYEEGYTIHGVQRILRDRGVRDVYAIGLAVEKLNVRLDTERMPARSSARARTSARVFRDCSITCPRCWRRAPMPAMKCGATRNCPILRKCATKTWSRSRSAVRMRPMHRGRRRTKNSPPPRAPGNRPRRRAHPAHPPCRSFPNAGACSTLRAKTAVDRSRRLSFSRPDF